MLNREEKFAAKFWTPNMDSNFFYLLFEALRVMGVNSFVEGTESPRESESHRGLVFDSGGAVWTRT